MRYFLLIIFIHFSLANAQSVFNEVYDEPTNKNNGLSKDLFEYNDFFIGLGVSSYGFLTPNVFNSGRSYILIIDNQGRYINSKEFKVQTGDGEIASGIIGKNDKLYIVGSYIDTLEHTSHGYNSYLFVTNENLDSIYLNPINVGFYDRSVEIFNYKDGFVLLGYVYDNTGLDSSLITLTQIDTLGNIQDVKYFGSSGYDFAYTMKPTDDGGFIISGRTDNHPIRVESNYLLLKVDSNLNQEWMYEYGDSTVDQYVRAFNSLEISQDRNFYFIFGEERYFSNIIGSNTAKAKLIKVFKGGNFIWEKTFDLGPTQYAQSIRAYSDGTLLLTGGVTRDSQGNYTYPRGFLLKVDEEGEVIWERRYSKWWWDGTGNPPLVNDDYVHNMIITQDGGILVSGYQIHDMPTNNDAWLIKFDSCGFTTGDIPEPLFVIENQNNLEVSLQNLSENYCTATLTWGDGEQEPIYAYSEPIYGYSPNLSHTYSEPGTYEICLEALAGEEFRTYCTEVNIQPNSITPPVGELEGVNIFPNPTNNYFILELPMNASSNSLPLGEGRGGVYSLTGQLIHQFPIKNQPQQKIDISHLAEGVYVIRIENGQYTAIKKLVVAR